jgi:REP element-mobilizing transposase RayT
MTYDPLIHHRRSIRLPGYDYAGGGAYFITICTQDKQFLFGEIVEGEMILAEEGSIVQRIWDTLPKTYGSLVLDTFQMMPNHLHGIFVLPGPRLSEPLALATSAPVIQPSPANFVGRVHGNDPHKQYSAGIDTDGVVRAGLALPSSTDAMRMQGTASHPPTEGGASGAQGRASPPPTSRRISMGDVVGGFKSISTIALNKFMSRPGAHPLHENFYEHIIRDTHELEMIREYIVQNPQRWLDDPENPRT